MLREWLLLWIWFLIFGVVIMVNCGRSFLKLRELQMTAAKFAETPGTKKIKDSQKRLLWIAFSVAVCTLMSAISTILIGSDLESWSENTDRMLTCTLYERPFEYRNWDGYAITPGAMVCQNADIAQSVGSIPGQHVCTSNCYFEEIGTFRDDEGVGTICLVREIDVFPDTLLPFSDYSWCDCPCSSYIGEIQRPSVTVLLISYLSQSLTLMVVGVNMGLREDYFSQWRQFLKRTNLTSKKPSNANSQILPQP
jgi:hypothetical protein